MMKLRNLILASLLFGRVVSGFADGGNGRCALPDEAPIFSFGVITDVHYSNLKAPWGTRRYAESGEKLREAMGAFHAMNVDFVVSLGDMIDGDIESYADIRPILDSSCVPVYKILGNHDFLGPYGSARQQRVLDELGICEPYFSVVKSGCRLLFLDSNDISVYARPEESAEYREASGILDDLKKEGIANARLYNGAIGALQQEWIARELAAAGSRGETVICLAHMPLMPQDGKFTLWNNRAVADLLMRHGCVKAFLAGHHHQGGCHAFDRIPHFTFQGMIEGSDNRYAVVEVYRDKLVIRGYGAQPGATLEYR